MRNLFEIQDFFISLLNKLQSPHYQLGRFKHGHRDYSMEPVGDGVVLLTGKEALIIAEKLSRADALAASLAFQTLSAAVAEAHEAYCNVGKENI